MDLSPTKYQKHIEGLYIFGTAGVGIMTHIPTGKSKLVNLDQNLSQNEKSYHRMIKTNSSEAQKENYQNY